MNVNAPRPELLPSRHDDGFTLIEAIMVIVITGILAAVVAVFITKPVQGYVDSVRRAELTDQADLVVRRIAREVHLSLHNSVRVGDSSGNVDSCAIQPSVICYIEFIPTIAGGRFRASGDGSSSGNFLAPAAVTFDVLGLMPSFPGIAAGDFIVVANDGPGKSPADAYVGSDTCTTNCNRARVSQPPTGNLITLATNPFTNTQLQSSNNNSFQVVSGSIKAVTFACPTVTRGNLTRYWYYGFNASLALVPSGNSGILAANATCQVSPIFTTADGQRLLTFNLTLADPSSGEQVSLFREIFMDN